MTLVRESRRSRARRHGLAVALLTAMAVILFALTLSLGQSFTPPVDVLRVLLGEDLPGVTFTIWQLRLPRALLGLLAGLSFGLGGVVFQILLRNPLASPDIIGISWGASAAAVFCIVVLSLSGPLVSVVAVAAGLAVALLVTVLSFRNGVGGTRFILVGIGVAAMLESAIAYVLSTAPSWTLQDAMRWLTGSLNSAQLAQSLPLALVLAGCGGLLLTRGRDLEALRMGDDVAAALGIRVAGTRAIVISAGVGMIATATAATGPIAFVAFLSGPIAARIVGNSGSLLIPSALVGASLVLLGDYIGQFLLPGRYPVGVVTGALGAPYLIYLIIRTNRSGGSL
ncbi:FecCD family ABC transporter permease [Rhizobium halophilum]|uniref:FecCD family ABC transporter permease n=1 Tax=Rhizobium halophilum TaxID=2846852 RepID=UPI001EFC9794|nr:iron ABC transporter permease [Rhizobium halophilum]MCF6370296.1 iron ABC transporter permease [Rhizobium halophilum]